MDYVVPVAVLDSFEQLIDVDADGVEVKSIRIFFEDFKQILL